MKIGTDVSVYSKKVGKKGLVKVSGTVTGFKSREFIQIDYVQIPFAGSHEGIATITYKYRFPSILNSPLYHNHKVTPSYHFGPVEELADQMEIARYGKFF
ncbi:hypothetical protein K8R47_02640 [archaeon]|nr:hypothetical protein [archaeon]